MDETDTAVLHPAHTGADGTCHGTAFDPETGTYTPCPHPAHTEPATALERLAVENAALRDALAKWRAVAAAYQLAARRG